MHVGMSVVFQAVNSDRSDHEIYRTELALADQAESKGFDSVWTAEHHFSHYIMSPNPAQFLTWVAARTSRVRLGTMVFVLPWHEPVRLAEEIALLDVLSEGRLVVGFGRGLGAREFDGFRLEMGESRQRFVEYAHAITGALESGTMEYDGELYTQPPVAIRPTPPFSFNGRVYASAVSPESARIMAELGFGIMIIAQKPWETTIAEIENYRKVFFEINGRPPPRPLLVNFTVLHEDAGRAAELQAEYGVAYARSVVEHYDFTNPRLATVPGYEYYAKLRENVEKHGLDRFAGFLSDLQIHGTPDEVVEQTTERIRLLDAAGVINAFSFGGMPPDVVQRSVELYADEVLPTLHATDTFRDVGPPQEVEAGSATA